MCNGLPELIRFLTIPLPMMPSPKNPKLRFDGLMSLSFKVLDELVRSNDGEMGRSAVGLSRNDDTAVDDVLFLLVDA